MKALELTVFKKEPGRYGREATYNSPDGLWAYPASHADGYAQRKRLTDAELAAELWFAKVQPACIKDNPKGVGTIVRELGSDSLSALVRFATLPHYDEPTITTGAPQ